MRKLLLLSLMTSVALSSSVASAQKFGKNGGVGSNDSVYANGEPSNGTYSINGTTGAAKLGPVTVNGPITATNISGSTSGVNTGDQINITGNAATATTAGKLTTARTINGVAFDGSGNISINAADTVARLSADNNLSDLTNLVTARANLGAAARGVNVDITSIAGSSAKWTTARTLSTSGDLGWSVSLDGSTNVTAAATIQPNVVTNAKSAQMTAYTVKGNATNAAANPSDLTQTQLTSLVNPFTSTLAGSVPASGGGTTNYLRADGTWAAIPASGAGNGSSSGSVTNFSFVNGSGVTGVVTNATTTPALSLSLGDITPTSIIARTTDNTSSFVTGINLYQQRSSDTASPASINITKTRGSVLAPTIVNNGDILGSYNILGYDGNTYLNALRIRAQVNGSVAAGSIPADTTFTVNGNTMLTMSGATNSVGLSVPLTGTNATFTGISTAAVHSAPRVVATDAPGVISDGANGSLSDSPIQMISKSNEAGMMFYKYGANAKGGVNNYVKTRDDLPNVYTTIVQPGDRVWANYFQAATGGNNTGHVAYESVYVDGPVQSGTTGEVPGAWYMSTGTGYAKAYSPNYYGVATSIFANSKQQVMFPGAKHTKQFIANAPRIDYSAGADLGAVVVIGPGDSIPSGAPLKFDYAHSTLLTTPEAGAIEVDTNNQMYITDGSAARHSVAYTDGTNWPQLFASSATYGSAGSGGTGAVVPVFDVSKRGLVTAASTYTLGTAANYPVGTSGASVPLLNTSNTFSGKITLQSTTSGSAGINFPRGPGATSPVDGDMYRSNSGSIRIWDGNLGVNNIFSFLNQPATWSAKQTMNYSTTTEAGFNIAPGTSPTTPVLGDIWTTSSNIQAQINGLTQIVQTGDIAAPTVAVDPASGSGNSVSVDSYGNSGKVTFTVTNSAPIGPIFTLTYAHAYSTMSYPTVSNGNQAASSLRIGAEGTKNGFTFYIGTTMNPGTYVFNYYAPGK